MALPAAQGLAVLYVLADEWMWRRNMMRLLGAKDEDVARLDTILATSPRPASREQRAAEVAAFVEGMGSGEIVTGDG